MSWEQGTGSVSMIIVATESQRVHDTGLTALVTERIVSNVSRPLHPSPPCRKRASVLFSVDRALLGPDRGSNDGMSSMKIAAAGAGQFQHYGSSAPPRHQPSFS